MKSKTKILRKADKAISNLKKIAMRMNGPNSVKVGLPKGSNNYPDGTSVIMVGTVHEFGSPSRGIPQRSFLRSTVREKRRSYKIMFKKIAKQIVDGKIDMKKGLGLIGLQVSTDVKEKITDIKSPALKYRQGNPLIDTGHLRQSITYKVTE